MPWDCLLIEAAWIAAMLPPPSTASPRRRRAAPPAAAWLVRWLLFRLLFGFGKLKFVGTSASDKLPSAIS